MIFVCLVRMHVSVLLGRETFFARWCNFYCTFVTSFLFIFFSFLFPLHFDRYGTTTYVMAPHKVLHTELMAHDPLKVNVV